MFVYLLSQRYIYIYIYLLLYYLHDQIRSRANIANIIFTRTPEIETANLSKYYAGLTVSQFHACSFFLINSSTATKIFETCD